MISGNSSAVVFSFSSSSFFSFRFFFFTSRLLIFFIRFRTRTRHRHPSVPRSPETRVRHHDIVSNKRPGKKETSPRNRDVTRVWLVAGGGGENSKCPNRTHHACRRYSTTVSLGQSVVFFSSRPTDRLVKLFESSLTIISGLYRKRFAKDAS